MFKIITEEMLTSRVFWLESKCKFTPKEMAAELSSLLVLTYTYLLQCTVQTQE